MTANEGNLIPPPSPHKMNACQFSPCRRYRYSLEHVIDPLLNTGRVMWIGLNPSTADEQKLDPTLRRIRAFTQAWGYSAFVMTNLFAFRATDPKDMKATADPIGEDNELMLQLIAENPATKLIIAAWGTHGDFNNRAMMTMGGPLRGAELHCLEETKHGHPKHPLYVPSNRTPRLFKSALTRAIIL